jgi:hypothetical protein
MRNLILLLALSGVVAAGCGAGDGLKGGSPADQAAAAGEGAKIDPQAAKAGDLETHTGTAGVRAVPPTTAGDRN